jgi:hypothetical protein
MTTQTSKWFAELQGLRKLTNWFRVSITTDCFTQFHQFLRLTGLRLLENGWQISKRKSFALIKVLFINSLFSCFVSWISLIRIITAGEASFGQRQSYAGIEKWVLPLELWPSRSSWVHMSLCKRQKGNFWGFCRRPLSSKIIPPPLQGLLSFSFHMFSYSFIQQNTASSFRNRLSYLTENVSYPYVDRIYSDVAFYLISSAVEQFSSLL